MSENTSVKKPNYLIVALKWLWMLAVLGAFIFYLFRNFSDILAQVSQVSPLLLLASLLLAMLGRLLFIGISSEILNFIGYPQKFGRVFYLAATSELGKYLPGGVWHLVGRAAYYRSLGMPIKTISRALIQENAWMLLAAGMAGSIFFILAYRGFNYSFAIIILLLTWWLILYLWTRPVALWRISAQLLIQVIVWLFWGYSFVLLLPSQDNFGLFLSMGAFAFSWLLGFVIIFAPGGLGVREAALVAFLLPILPSSEVLVFALIHRLLWVLVELVFGIIAWIFFDLK